MLSLEKKDNMKLFLKGLVEIGKKEILKHVSREHHRIYREWRGVLSMGKMNQ